MRRTLIFVSLLVLSACGPTRFNQATQSFATSVGSLSTSVSDTYAGLGADEAMRRSTQAMFRRTAPVLPGGCAAPLLALPPPEPNTPPPIPVRREACGIVEQGSAFPPLHVHWSNEGNARLIARLLRDYAKSLSDLTSADTRQKQQDAVDGIAAAVAAIGVAAGPAGYAVAAASIKVAGFVIIESLEYRRFLLLRESVRFSAPAIKVFSDLLNLQIRNLQSSRISLNYQEARELSRHLTGLSRSEREARITEIANRAEIIAALQRADVSAAAGALTEAYDKLRTALDNNDPDLPELTAALNRFAAVTKELATSISDLNAER